MSYHDCNLHGAIPYEIHTPLCKMGKDTSQTCCQVQLGLGFWIYRVNMNIHCSTIEMNVMSLHSDCIFETSYHET